MRLSAFAIGFVLLSEFAFTDPTSADCIDHGTFLHTPEKVRDVQINDPVHAEATRSRYSYSLQR